MVQRTSFEDSVLEALLGLERAVASTTPPTPNPALRPALVRIGELTSQAPADLDPQLRHFLQRGSYEKARLWLEGVRE